MSLIQLLKKFCFHTFDTCSCIYRDNASSCINLLDYKMFITFHMMTNLKPKLDDESMIIISNFLFINSNKFRVMVFFFTEFKDLCVFENKFELELSS